MESSRWSLRFDEFPTSMKPRHRRWRATRLLASWKTQDRQSLDAGPKRNRHARTPPSAFPFLRITMSKSRWQCSRSHTPEPPMEAKPPLGVNDSRGVCPDEVPRHNPLLSDGSRGRAQPRRKWERPALRIYLGIPRPDVKRSVRRWSPTFSRAAWPWGHIPARIRRHSHVVNGVVTIIRDYGYDEPPRGIDQDLVRSQLTCKASGNCGLLRMREPGGPGKVPNGT